jgi:DNA topoisomerase-2
MPNVKEIIEKFYDIRLRFYDKRKEYLKSKLVRDLVLLKEKERFILEVV